MSKSQSSTFKYKASSPSPELLSQSLSPQLWTPSPKSPTFKSKYQSSTPSPKSLTFKSRFSSPSPTPSPQISSPSPQVQVPSPQLSSRSLRFKVQSYGSQSCQCLNTAYIIRIFNSISIPHWRLSIETSNIIAHEKNLIGQQLVTYSSTVRLQYESLRG